MKCTPKQFARGIRPWWREFYRKYEEVVCTICFITFISSVALSLVLALLGVIFFVWLWLTIVGTVAALLLYAFLRGCYRAVRRCCELGAGDE